MALTPQDSHKAVITSVGSAIGGGTANSTKPVITGTADAGATVDIFDGVRMIGTVIVASNGTWSFTPTADLKAGSHSFTAISVDSNGDMGASSTPMSVTVPSGTPVGPVKPVIDGGGPTDDTGHPLPNPTNDPRPEMSGTGTPGDTITMYDGNTPIGSTVIDSTGHWDVKPEKDLAAGTHDIYVIETNPAGVPSQPSDHYPVVIDTSVPATPAAPTLTDDSGAAIPGGSATADARPHINGTGKAGDIITVYDGSTVLGSTTVGSDGQWTFTPSSDLSQGSHSINVTETNLAGTQSPHSGSASFTFAVGHVPTETVTITNLVDDTGVGGAKTSVANGGGTADTHPMLQGTVSGSLASDEQVAIYRDDQQVGYATVIGTAWSYQDSGVSVGAHIYTARVQTAGNAGPTSNSFSFTEWASAGNVSGLQITNDIVSYYRQLSMTGTLPDVNGNKQYLDLVIYNGDGSRASIIFQSVTLPLPSTKWYSEQAVPGSYMMAFEYSMVGGVKGAQHLVGFVSATAVANTAYGVATAMDMDLTTLPSAFKGLLGTTMLSVTYSDAADHANASSVADSTHTDAAVSPTSHSTNVGEHDAFVGKVANGNETVNLNADPSTYFKETTAHIEGAKGGAIDTLHLTGDHQVLDLTSLTGQTAAAKISGIEVVDLGGQHNTLKLSLIDVLNLGETDLFQKDGKQQMMVQGKEGDTVDLSNTHIAGLADGEWAQHGTAVVGGVTYNVYEHLGAHTELLVQQGVQIVVH